MQNTWKSNVKGTFSEKPLVDIVRQSDHSFIIYFSPRMTNDQLIQCDIAFNVRCSGESTRPSTTCPGRV